MKKWIRHLLKRLIIWALEYDPSLRPFEIKLVDTPVGKEADAEADVVDVIESIVNEPIASFANEPVVSFPPYLDIRTPRKSHR